MSSDSTTDRAVSSAQDKSKIPEQNKKESNDREPALPDDGHRLWEWETKYGPDAWVHIKKEAFYMAGLLLVGIVAIILNYTGLLYCCYSNHQHNTIPVSEVIFHKQMWCVIFGFLGSTVYGIKILYKAVARGKWHKDRVLWRYFTPWVSAVLAIVVASTMSGSVFANNSYAPVFVGFFAGYFSESAIGKLYAIADILFN